MDYEKRFQQIEAAIMALACCIEDGEWLGTVKHIGALLEMKEAKDTE